MQRQNKTRLRLMQRVTVKRMNEQEEGDARREGWELQVIRHSRIVRAIVSCDPFHKTLSRGSQHACTAAGEMLLSLSLLPEAAE